MSYDLFTEQRLARIRQQELLEQAERSRIIRAHRPPRQNPRLVVVLAQLVSRAIR